MYLTTTRDPEDTCTYAVQCEHSTIILPLPHSHQVHSLIQPVVVNPTSYFPEGQHNCSAISYTMLRVESRNRQPASLPAEVVSVCRNTLKLYKAINQRKGLTFQASSHDNHLKGRDLSFWSLLQGLETISFTPSVHTCLKNVLSNILARRTLSVLHPRQLGIFLKKTFIGLFPWNDCAQQAHMEKTNE